MLCARIGCIEHSGAHMNWPRQKRWVYSITYDEGCQALLDHALAVHREYGVPGLAIPRRAVHLASEADAAS